MNATLSAKSISANVLLFLAGALAGSAVVLAAGPARAAGGAFQVDDSEIGAVGDCKVEAWTAMANAPEFIGTVAPACVVSLGRPVEFGAAFARFQEAGEWGSVAVFKGKINLIPVEAGRIGIGLIAGGATDLINPHINGAFVTVPVSFQLHEQVRLNVNGGWLGNPSTGENVASWGAGFEWNFVEPMTLIGEVFGFAGGDHPQPRFQLGLRYTPVKAFDVDVIYGHNLVGENASWLTLGLNVRFNASGPPK